MLLRLRGVRRRRLLKKSSSMYGWEKEVYLYWMEGCEVVIQVLSYISATTNNIWKSSKKSSCSYSLSFENSLLNCA